MCTIRNITPYLQQAHKRGVIISPTLSTLITTLFPTTPSLHREAIRNTLIFITRSLFNFNSTFDNELQMILRYSIQYFFSKLKRLFFISSEAGSWHCEMKQLTPLPILLQNRLFLGFYFLFWCVLNREVIICNVTIIFSNVKRTIVSFQ